MARSKMKIIPLKKKHLPKAATLLALAFLKDPLFKYYTKSIKKEKEQKKTLKSLITEDIEMHIENDHPVYGIKKGKKIIGLISMQKVAANISPFKYIKSFFRLLKKGVSILVILRVIKFAVKTRSFGTKDHHYISHLAVHPHHQKKGIGKKLMTFMTTHAKKLNPTKGIGLSTNKIKNLSFYGKSQYRVFKKKRFSKFTRFSLIKKD